MERGLIREMDFYRFIHSRDVRRYLQEIRYSFTATEAAFLVWQCRNANLEEKCTAWQAVIDTLPDCFWNRRPGLRALNSFHDFLRRHIVRQREKLKGFCTGKDYVYTYEYHESPRKDLSEDDGWRTEHILFDRFEDCLSCCLRDMQGAADRIRIEKRPVFHSNGTSGRRVQTLELNAEGKPLSIEAADEAEEDTDEVFDHMWFAFPTPFRCGNIVWNPAAAPGQPFVLDYLNTWNTVEMIEKGFMEGQPFQAAFVQEADKRVQHYQSSGDTSDMGAYGYGFRKDFGIWEEFGGYANYLDIEYYPLPLEGENRALKPLSEFLKGNCGVELLLNGYAYLLLEQHSRSLREKYAVEYTGEGLKAAGV